MGYRKNRKERGSSLQTEFTSVRAADAMITESKGAEKLNDETLKKVAGGSSSYSHVVESEEQCFNECGNIDNGTRFCYGYGCPAADMVGKVCERYDFGI